MFRLSFLCYVAVTICRGVIIRKLPRSPKTSKTICDWLDVRNSGSANTHNDCRIKIPKTHHKPILDRAAYSGPNWTPIPEQTGHAFRFKLDSDSGANWTLIPVANWTVFYS